MCELITNLILQFLLNVKYLQTKNSRFKGQHRSKSFILRAYIG